MASTLAGTLLEAVISQLTHELVSGIEQKVLLKDYEENFEWLQDELRRMECFLKDSGSGEDQQRADRINEIRKLAYDAADLISKVSLDKELQIHKPRLVVGGLDPVIFKWKHWSVKKKIFREIKAIKKKYMQINQSRNTSSANHNQASLQRAPSYILTRTSKIVGLEKETKGLVKQLIENENMKRRSVVPIVGMAGIGKSTLAWNILNHPDVQSVFALRAWVTVTNMQQLDYRNVQVKIFSGPSQAEEQQGLEDFTESLRENRYLVVLDGVGGSSQHRLWDDRLLQAFPDVQNGSRIIITTRMNDVALYLGTHISSPLKVNHLDDQKSWELFCEEASFTTRDRVLQDIGKKIVRGCGGLPLSIVTMAGKLNGIGGRRRDWEEFYKQENGKLPDEVLKVLDQSYNELTPELQDCFLCLGFFPINDIIPARRLTQLWIAEDLVSDQGEGLEAAAESHLDMLLERNMIQPVKTNPDGSVKACRVDISLQQLSTLKAKEVSFLDIHKDDKFCPSSYNRHRAIHCSTDRYFDSEDPSSQLRSLVFVVSNGKISLSQLEIMCKRFKLLKLLHLEGMLVGHLPEEIGNLRNLRYLNLRKTSIDKLQPSMRNLKRLLTLDIRNNMYVTGLEVIKDMTSLQNLYLPGYYEGFSLDGLSQLQVLKWVKLGSTEFLESLAKLRTLKMQLEEELSLDDLLDSAKKLEKLESLHLYPSIEISSLDTDKFKDLTSLTKLYIKGGVRELPIPDNFPPYLMQLTLDGSGLIPFPLNDLGKLPKLSILRLRNLYIKDEKLCFSAEGFHRLKYLELLHLWNLKDLELKEEGALQWLRQLKISNCTALDSLPKEIKQLTNLSELHIDKMGETFEKKIREGGENHERVQHVLFIKFTNTLKSYEEM